MARRDPLLPLPAPRIPPGARSRAALMPGAAAGRGRCALPRCAACGRWCWPVPEVCPCCLGPVAVADALRGSRVLAATVAAVPAEQSGLVDRLHTPAGLCLERVPEGAVLSASSLPPMHTRKTGASDRIASICQRQGNARRLANLNASAGIHLWTVNEPRLMGDGMLDFRGIIIRASPLYRTLFGNLGATFIIEPAPEVYTSLERGAIDANAYPVPGHAAFGRERFTKYRVDPSFFRMDVLISMNKDARKALSPEAQKTVGETAAVFAERSYNETAALAARLAQEMIDTGQRVVEMTGAGRERFRQMAADASWQRMEARDPTCIAQMKALFHQGEDGGRVPTGTRPHAVARHEARTARPAPRDDAGRTPAIRLPAVCQTPFTPPPPHTSTERR